MFFSYSWITKGSDLQAVLMVLVAYEFTTMLIF